MEHKLYPLKFTPVLKDKIWGGNKMKTQLGIDFHPLPNCGEAWMVSGVEDNTSVVSNGFLQGNELNELVEIYMGDLVGDEIFNRFGNEFPLLIKFIDAADWLSIQVHPDDELAAKRGIGFGKTEMWYIMEADNEAQLITGFKRDTSREEYVGHLNNNRLKQLLNFEQVKNGDVFYMPAGRVHALGPGILLAEIQQTSDTTYRIFDWNRVDDQGKPRELHTEEALDAIDYKSADDYKAQYKPIHNGTATLVESPFFTTNLIQLDAALAKDYTELDSFVIYIAVEGSFTLVHDGTDEQQVKVKKGETLLLPAVIDRVDIIPDQPSKILEVFIQ